MTINRTHLVFDSDIGKNKPITIIKNDIQCPFCNRDQLDGIIAEDGPILFLKNKYPVLRDTVQTVLIETYDCNSELSTYSKEHLYKVIHFGIEKWQEMMNSGQFRSVIFYKNHGPFSGGTIKHAHMQIVGLKYLDYTPNLYIESFQGDKICEEKGVELNLTKQPQVGFFEFNILLKELNAINRMADYIQMTIHYLLNYFHKNCNSYNLFFYKIDGNIAVKIVPRFITSPLFIGYGIPQITSRTQEIIKQIQMIYL